MSTKNSNIKNHNLGISVVSKRTLMFIRIFALIKNIRTVVLAIHYDRLRRKYSSIMTSQFINGYSLSEEYYKYKRLKRKDEYWSAKFDKIIEDCDNKYICNDCV